MERQSGRYAHADGHTDVIYTKNGSELLTCGSDGDVRVWSGLDDDDPKSACVGEWALSIHQLDDDRLFVSTDNHAVQIYTFPGFDKDGIVTRFTAPVTHIVGSRRTSNLVCCSENMEAKLCSKEENKWSAQIMSHQGPVLGVAVCPLGKHCVTSCGDGLFRIWNLADSATMIKELPGVPKANSFYSAKVLGRASFEPINGKLLAYPSNKDVILLDSKTWQEHFKLSSSQIKSPLSICLFSPCGNYLAASTTTGEIAVWNVNEKSCVGITEHPNSLNISSLAWNPTENGELAFCDVSGQLAAITNCYGSKNDDEEPMDENLDLIDIIEREKENGDDLDYPDSVGGDDDDDENTISLRKLKKETLDMPQRDEKRTAGSRSRSHSRSRSKSPVPVRIPMMAAQPPFQPSSTPINLEHRYMCWNEVGIVRCHTIDDNSNIDVEFHDSATHHSIHLNNHLNHTLASLSRTVLALACEVPSKIVCIALIGGSKEWSVTLGDLEEVLCVAATDTLVATATSVRLLRLYTTFGTQLHVISLLGSPICLAGRNGNLNVVYHSSDPGINDQNVSMDNVLVKGTDVRCRRSGIKVALGGGARLQWFGTTDRGSAVSLDSTGILRLYDFVANCWVPVCDTTGFYKGVSDTYFVISVSEELQSVSAILCRGANYPHTVPPPLATNLPLRLPLCEMETEKGQHEELLRRSTILKSFHSDNSRTELVLKLFALACRSEIEYRAIEIVELLRDQQLAILAARYASRLGKLHLADKLTNLADSWKEETIVEPEAVDHEEMNDEPSAIENESEDLNASIILPVSKKRNDIVPLKPMPLFKSSQGNKNPFRLSTKSGKENAKSLQSNPLSLTERSLVNDDSPQADATSEKKIISNPLPSEQFPQWYERNKDALQEEHSDLTPSELTKIGVRTFKNLRSQSNDSTPKRKHSPEPEETGSATKSTAPKQSKLAAFSFQKREK